MTHQPASTTKTHKKSGIFSFLNSRWSYNLILSVCVLTLLFSAFRIIEWNAENSKTGKLTEELSYKADKTEVEATNIPDDNSDPSTTPTSSKKPMYTRASIAKIKELNPDTVSWLKVNGTRIDYPVLLSKTDTGETSKSYFYLDHSFDKTYSTAGWVFADFRNDYDDFASNQHLIFYGHNRNDGSMFGTLNFLRKDWWQKDKSNHYISVTTGDTMTIWKIFSVMDTTTEFNYIRTKFYSNTDFIDFCNSLQDKNTAPTLEKKEFNKNDKILTLSTCVAFDERRFTAHAYLVSSAPISVDENNPLTVPGEQPAPETPAEGETPAAPAA